MAELYQFRVLQDFRLSAPEIAAATPAGALSADAIYTAGGAIQVDEREALALLSIPRVAGLLQPETYTPLKPDLTATTSDAGALVKARIAALYGAQE